MESLPPRERKTRGIQKKKKKGRPIELIDKYRPRFRILVDFSPIPICTGFFFFVGGWWAGGMSKASGIDVRPFHPTLTKPIFYIYKYM